jgi:ABC-type transport system involved in multi-copper enzyme maturation permease subunit
MTATLNASQTTERPPVAASMPGIPFGRLVRVEWGKSTDTRAARWLLVLVAVITIAIMLVPIIGEKSNDQDYANYLSIAALGLTILLPVVSILTLTSEWTQRTVLATFTQEPRRIRVVMAKVVVSVLLALGAAVFGAIVTAAALGVAAATGRHLDANITGLIVVGYLLFVLLNVLMGVAFGALLHNTPAAIVLLFAIPGVLGILGSAVKSVGHWIDPSTTLDWALNGEWGGHTPQILVSVVLWIAAPLVLGVIRTVRREIK